MGDTKRHFDSQYVISGRTGVTVQNVNHRA
jgi:hypothetical protein